MPIAPENIAKLIKQARLKKIDSWLQDYYKRIARDLQVHTKGQLFAKIDTLFPNEHPDSKAHCIATYEPITKSSIWKGINNLSRIFSNSSFSFTVSEELNNWLQEYKHDGQNLLNYFLELWLHKAIAEDPNGLFVVYPPEWAEERQMCPVQFVRSELIRAYGQLEDGTRFVAFASEHDSEVTYDVETVTHHREVYYDEEIEGLNARSLTRTTYNQRLEIQVVKEVVHVVTTDGILIYEEGNRDELTYTLLDFPEKMSAMPVFPAGGNLLDRAKVPIYESFVGSFVPFGNLALLQHRNHRAVDLQFSYPRMAELQTPCDQCQGGRVKVKKSTAYPDGTRKCTNCKGSGWVTTQSPYKAYTRKYDPNDEGENKHLNVPPIEFFAPDVAIVTYSKDAWRDYLKMAEEAIFIMQKVYTGQVQSEESKKVDLDDMHAWLLNISRTYYGTNLRALLQALEDYMVRDPMTVTVEKPYSFAILTEEEAFLALTEILASEAPVFVKANRVEEFVNKFVSKSSPIVRALAILKQYDTLLFYNTEEISTFKGANTITAPMWTKHILGYPLLVQLYMEDPTLFEQEDAAVIAKLDAKLKEMAVPEPGADFRTAIRTQLQTLNNTPAA